MDPWALLDQFQITLLSPISAIPRLTFLFIPPDKLVTITFLLGIRFNISIYLVDSTSAFP